jgi:hypothetical protein
MTPLLDYLQHFFIASGGIGLKGGIYIVKINLPNTYGGNTDNGILNKR